MPARTHADPNMSRAACRLHTRTRALELQQLGLRYKHGMTCLAPTNAQQSVQQALLSFACSRLIILFFANIPVQQADVSDRSDCIIEHVHCVLMTSQVSRAIRRW